MLLSAFGYYADFLGSLICCFFLCILAMSQGAWLVRAEWLASLMIGAGLWTLLDGKPACLQMQLARKRDAAPIVRDYITDVQRRYREIETDRSSLPA